MFRENRRWTKIWKYYYFVLDSHKIECYLSGSTATLFDEMSYSKRCCSVRSLCENQDTMLSMPGSVLTGQYLLELRAGDQVWVLAFMPKTEKEE